MLLLLHHETKPCFVIFLAALVRRVGYMSIPLYKLSQKFLLFTFSLFLFYVSSHYIKFIIARGRGSTDRAQRTKTTKGQYSPVRLETTRLVSSLLYGTRSKLVYIKKRTSGHLNSSEFPL